MKKVKFVLDCIKSIFIGFGLVWFYDISTIVGYLLLNTVYTYTFDVYD